MWDSFSLFFWEHPIINLLTKEVFLTAEISGFTPALGYPNLALNNTASYNIVQQGNC